MTASRLRHALGTQFETIRRAEMRRLEKKLRGLPPEARGLVDAVSASVVHAIAGLPEPSPDVEQQHIDAVVQLFALE